MLPTLARPVEEPAGRVSAVCTPMFIKAELVLGAIFMGELGS